jgi:Arc/MetJ-type ribon-helix-helix transcriptional regulator
MKTLTVRLPENLVAEIESESRSRNVSKSDVVRERLQSAGFAGRRKGRRPSFKELAGDLIGSVKGDGLPSDLSANKKKYLRDLGYGQNGNRR